MILGMVTVSLKSNFFLEIEKREINTMDIGIKGKKKDKDIIIMLLLEKFTLENGMTMYQDVVSLQT